MNQPSSPSDNLFLRSYATLRAKGMKLTGRLTLLAVLPLVAIVLLLAIAKLQLNADVAVQADRIGEELARQIAASVADPLAADDQLSLNIQLAQWKRNPLISHVRLYTAENRLIAEAGDEPARGRKAPGQGEFNTVVHFQEAMVGQVQLSLAAAPLVGPANATLWRLFWGALILGLIAALIAWQIARGMRGTLQGLGNWHGDSGHAAPGIGRHDELGELARQLNQRRIVDMPPEPEAEETEEAEPASSANDDAKDPQPDQNDDLQDPAQPIAETTTIAIAAEPAEEEREAGVRAESATAAEEAGASATESENIPADTPEDAQNVESAKETPPAIAAAQPETAILAVRLGNQEALRRLARPRLMNLLERYRAQLQQACALYNGHLHTLHDGTSLVTFHARECRQDELTHALCCGELLRVLGHELQVEIADTGITLHLQLAIGHVVDLSPLGDAELAVSTECQPLMDAVQHSRNLLLLDAALANSAGLKERAVVRRLASQPGIYCIERLHGPYQAMLERQLTHFYHQRPD
ncbi:MAG: hypothetical protein JKY26_09870 [Pseudomonas sp.]|nr:hypothetical protein [Pseudomonas sp.]